MKKSVYSLVLMDDVVHAIDRLASEQNTSRSALINQILAEHVSLSTPEMRMRDIFDVMERQMSEAFQNLTRSSDSMLSLRSPLQYKYRPSVRYHLELYRDTSAAIGRLKVSLRTQNRELIDRLNAFFRMWIDRESRTLHRYFPEGIGYGLGDGCLTRELYHPINLPVFGSSDVGEAIAAYIRLLDDTLKDYFANLDRSAAELSLLLEEHYRQFLGRPGRIII